MQGDDVDLVEADVAEQVRADLIQHGGRAAAGHSLDQEAGDVVAADGHRRISSLMPHLYPRSAASAVSGITQSGTARLFCRIDRAALPAPQAVRLDKQECASTRLHPPIDRRATGRRLSTPPSIAGQQVDALNGIAKEEYRYRILVLLR